MISITLLEELMKILLKNKHRVLCMYYRDYTNIGMSKPIKELGVTVNVLQP
jgi:hypothetical protein